MRKPMIFQSDTAYNQLKQAGMVYSARATPYEERSPVWIRRGRNTPKEFDAEIRNVHRFDKENISGGVLGLENQLKHFLDMSGFKSIQRWVEEIQTLNNGAIPDPLYVVKVVRMTRDDTETGDGE